MSRNRKIESIAKSSVLHRDVLRKHSHILSPIKAVRAKSIEEIQDVGRSKIVRVRLNGEYYELDEEIPTKQVEKMPFLVVDRVAIRPGIEKGSRGDRTSNSPNKRALTIALSQRPSFNLSLLPSTGVTSPPAPHLFLQLRRRMCPDCLGLGFQWGANVLSHQKIMAPILPWNDQ